MKKLFFSIFLFATLTSFSQQDISKKMSCYIGFGTSNFLSVSYDYNLFSFDFSYDISIMPKKLFFALQPSYNRSSFFYDANAIEKTKAWETGLLLSVKYHLMNEYDKLRLYLQIGSGPHYLSEPLDRQVAGFLFSNNLYLGIELSRIEFRFGIRHISNAEIKLPNGGINNLLISSGFRF